ncbi:MAG: GNAT family N-acetyltransferase [Alphaproteobacteria bacterium]|nr:GNAT family N-acetyltransferase [Alphaproteobacteria bacterium]
MDKIDFVPLSGIYEEEIIDLMNNREVGQYLPLLVGEFTAESCRDFLKAKKRLWDDHGFGPWAILIHGEFAGWGGIQPEQGEADFGLVLHPKYWGWGRKIFNKIKDQAFNEMGFMSIIILLPPNRPNINAVKRFGFLEDGQLTIDDQIFLRFRLNKPKFHK